MLSFSGNCFCSPGGGVGTKRTGGGDGIESDEGEETLGGAGHDSGESERREPALTAAVGAVGRRGAVQLAILDLDVPVGHARFKFKKREKTAKKRNISKDEVHLFMDILMEMSSISHQFFPQHWLNSYS